MFIIISLSLWLWLYRLFGKRSAPCDTFCGDNGIANLISQTKYFCDGRDEESGALVITIMDPLADDAGLSDSRDRAYIGKLLDVLKKTVRTIIKGGKKAGGGEGSLFLQLNL